MATCEDTLNYIHSNVVYNKGTLVTVSSRVATALKDIASSRAVLDGSVININAIKSAVDNMNATDLNQINSYINSILSTVGSNYTGINVIRTNLSSCINSINAIGENVILNKNSLSTLLTDLTSAKTVIDSSATEITNILTAVNSINETDFSQINNYLLTILDVVQANYAGVMQIKTRVDSNDVILNSKLDSLLSFVSSGDSIVALQDDINQIKTFLGLPL